MEKIIPLSEMKAKLNSIVDQVMERDDEFIITKSGHPAAVLVPHSLFESWKETKEIQADKAFMKEIKKGIERLKRGCKRYSFEEVFGEPLE